MNIYSSFLSFLLFIIPATLLSQDFDISKIQPGSETINKALIYSLPRTSLKVNLKITKYIVKKGPYAEFAQKYLGLTNVAMSDSEIWQITGIECVPVDEPDPLNYYGLTFKTLPSNLHTIYSLHNHGILLNAPEAIKALALTIPDKCEEKTVLDPQFIDDAITERTDTFYKTIMNDTAFVRIPVFKKQIHAKTLEELAKETAHEITKTRKRKIKIIRGEYDFHPDAATLRLMFDEMQKLEEYYLQLFQGIKNEQKYTYQFNILPTDNLSTIDIGYFNKEKGFSKSQFAGSETVSVHFQKNESLSIIKSSMEKELSKNNILYRVPSPITVTFTSDKNEISRIRVPFYQFGSIQTLFLKLK